MLFSKYLVETIEVKGHSELNFEILNFFSKNPELEKEFSKIEITSAVQLK